MHYRAADENNKVFGLWEKLEMYLISLYFDEVTDNKIRSYMKQIAKRTGNISMLQENIPPHITIGAFRTDTEEKAIKAFEKITENVGTGTLQWVSTGMFLPQVIFLSPVLNEYLQNLSETIYKEMLQMSDAEPQGKYRPYGWMPHATLAKHLTQEQMKAAFEVMLNQFGPFESQAVRIGLAKTNPYTDIRIFDLK